MSDTSTLPYAPVLATPRNRHGDSIEPLDTWSHRRAGSLLALWSDRSTICDDLHDQAVTLARQGTAIRDALIDRTRAELEATR